LFDRDFARHGVQISCEDGSGEGRPVAVRKLDKQTWTCAPCPGPLTVTYEVYAWDLSVRAAHLDTTHGYFNGTSVFLAVHGKENDPCSVEILPPAGDAYRDWRIATSMARQDAEPWGFGTHRACDYGIPSSPGRGGGSSSAASKPWGTARCRHHRPSPCRPGAAVRRPLCVSTISASSRAAHGPHLLIWAVGAAGGLEHRASASLLCSRDELPRSHDGDDGVSEGYRTFLGLASHEYFHLWNIKRIKPKAFVPYDLSREVHTRLLWAFEGFTSYYDDLALVRSGLIPPESPGTGRTATRCAAAGTLEVVQLMRIKFYRQDENSQRHRQHYAKGALVALR
jgi:predicted metalloprotease with PDZ domain